MQVRFKVNGKWVLTVFVTLQLLAGSSYSENLEIRSESTGLLPRFSTVPELQPSPAPLLRSPHVFNNLWVLSGGALVIQVGLAGILSTFPGSSTGWGRGSLNSIITNAAAGPTMDRDAAHWNFIIHPVFGSELYVLARNHNCSWWQSLLYAGAMSTFWEFVTEGYYERASWQDLFITPIAGSLLGELRYQAKHALKKNGSTGALEVISNIAAFVIDPIDGLGNL